MWTRKRVCQGCLEGVKLHTSGVRSSMGNREVPVAIGILLLEARHEVAYQRYQELLKSAEYKQESDAYRVQADVVLDRYAKQFAESDHSDETAEALQRACQAELQSLRSTFPLLMRADRHQQYMLSTGLTRHQPDKGRPHYVPTGTRAQELYRALA